MPTVGPLYKLEVEFSAAGDSIWHAAGYETQPVERIEQVESLSKTSRLADRWHPLPVHIETSKKKPDWFSFAFYHWLVSRRLGDALAAVAGDAVELLPVVVEGQRKGLEGPLKPAATDLTGLLVLHVRAVARPAANCPTVGWDEQIEDGIEITEDAFGVRTASATTGEAIEFEAGWEQQGEIVTSPALAFTAKTLAGKHLFRLPGGEDVFVSEAVRQLCEREGFRGAQLTSVPLIPAK